MTTTTTKLTGREKAKLLVPLFREAKEEALAADPLADIENPTEEQRAQADGGSCNFDTPAFRVPRMQEDLIIRAAQVAGVSVTRFEWFGGKRWFWLNVPLHGQANRRSVMMEAAQRVLREFADANEWFDACGYQQAD